MRAPLACAQSVENVEKKKKGMKMQPYLRTKILYLKFLISEVIIGLCCLAYRDRMLKGNLGCILSLASEIYAKRQGLTNFLKRRVTKGFGEWHMTL